METSGKSGNGVVSLSVFKNNFYQFAMEYIPYAVSKFPTVGEMLMPRQGDKLKEALWEFFPRTDDGEKGEEAVLGDGRSVSPSGRYDLREKKKVPASGLLSSEKSAGDTSVSSSSSSCSISEPAYTNAPRVLSAEARKTRDDYFVNATGLKGDILVHCTQESREVMEIRQ